MVVAAVAIALVGVFAAWLEFGWGGSRAVVVADDVGELTFAVAAATCCGVAARRSRGLTRARWAALVVGLGAWAAGEMVWCWYEVLQDVEVPFPSIPDVGFLLFPVGALVALRLWPSAVTATASRVWLLLDGLIVAGSSFVLSWVTVLRSVADADSDGAGSLAVALAYPASDLVLLTVIVLVLAWSRPLRWLPLGLFAAGLAAMAVSDSAFAYLTAVGGYRSSVLDAGWAAAFALIALAAVVETVPLRAAVPADDPPPAMPGWAQLLLPYATPLAAGAVVVGWTVAGRSVDLPEFIVGGCVLVLVMVRQFVVLVDNRRLIAAVRDQAQQIVDQLTTLDRERDIFVYTVSHELRTPLTSIAGYIELLADGAAGPVSNNQRRMLAIVDRNAKRLHRLIEDLLTLSRIQAGTFTVEVAPIRLGPLINESVEAIRPLAQQKALELRRHCDGDATLIVGDAVQLERALLNLLSNAVKFTPDNGTVTISTREELVDVVVEVADTGVGIPADEQDKLFSRFFRASTARKNAVPGLGLGLSVVAAVVEHHGGQVRLESIEGEGTTATLRLPRVLADSPNPDAACRL